MPEHSAQQQRPPITVELIPAEGLHVGDTLTVRVRGLDGRGSGRAYVSLSIFGGLGVGTWIGPRQTLRGDGDVAYTLGGPGTLACWVDTDADMSNGVAAYAQTHVT